MKKSIASFIVLILLAATLTVSGADTFRRTTALNKIRKMKKLIHIIQGGTSAGKTFAVLPIMIDKCCKIPFREMSVVSESIPHLKQGAMKDFIKIMKSTGRWNESRWHDTDRKYTFANGSYIEFTIPERAIGPRRTDLFVNEANHILFQDYHDLAIRTSDEIWIDFNPAAEFWAHTELMSDPDADFIILTYKDNEALPAKIVRDIEKARAKAATGDPYWVNWWKVYGLGQVGSLEGVIFGTFNFVQEFPVDCDWIGYGLDFGFTNDPTALVKIGYKQGQIYLEQMIYQTGLLNSEIIKRMKAFGITNEEIIADSADPKSIAELKLAGFNIDGAVKGTDSIINGIGLMKEFTFNIVASSLELIKEWRTYSWKKNKATNKWMNEPVDFFNHAIDAIRYFVSYKLGHTQKGLIIAYGSTAHTGTTGKEMTDEQKLEKYYQDLNDD